MIPNRQRALTLREALEAHFNVNLPGAEVMIEQTLEAAQRPMSFAASLGAVKVCPKSNRPCGWGCGDACVLSTVQDVACRHMSTTTRVMNGIGVTYCFDCGRNI